MAHQILKKNKTVYVRRANTSGGFPEQYQPMNSGNIRKPGSKGNHKNICNFDNKVIIVTRKPMVMLVTT
jgi:hypothetical protein